MTNYSAYDDVGLVQLLANGDEGAFNEIYHRYWTQLFAMAVNRLKDKSAAEDVVHDVFAGLWHNRTAVQIDKLENYLAVAVKYTILNVLRKRQYEKHYLETAIGTVNVEAVTEQQVQYKWLLQKVQTEIEKLPEKCRLIFKYSRNQGMPVKEIARQLHLSPKTVENQLTRAIRQLRVAVKSAIFSLATFFIHLF
ncbi:MAG: RNA polymerase sigma-70 factor [Ferruginibacter sp.]